MSKAKSMILPPSSAEMFKAAERACSLLKVLANSDRLLIMCQLSMGESCVSDLETGLEIRQPTLSQQLAVLRNHELVSTRREGKSIYYSITSTEALAVMAVVYEQYCPKA